MQNTFYEQFFETQKTMFEDWQKNMKNAFGNFPKGEATDFNFPDYYDKLFKAGQEFWEKGFDEWKKQTQAAGQFSGMAGNFDFDPAEYYKNMATTAQDFWKKADESKKTYSMLGDLWRRLSEATAAQDNKGVRDIAEEWSKQYASLLRSYLIPNMPGFTKEFCDKVMDYYELSGEKAWENFNVWMGGAEDIQQAMKKMMDGSPNSYIEFMEILKKNYDATFGRMTQMPMFGKDMEFWRRYRDNYDRFVKFNMASTGFYSAMYEVIRESTQKVIEEYMAMPKDQPQTFEEFYKYWAQQVSATYDKVLFSEQYGRLAGNMVDEMAKFKIAYDELCESYLAHLPIAKKSDMDALYKTVYELKKEIRSLKKEIKNYEKREK